MIPVNIHALVKANEVIAQWLSHFEKGTPKPGVLRKEMEATQAARQWQGVKGTEGICKYLRQVRGEIAAVIDSATKNKASCIVHHYEQAPSGRRYAVGLNLQNSTRLTRHIATNGCYSYDFATCHHTIALQVAQQADLKLDYLAHYVSNKDAVRSALAKHTRQPVKAIKSVLCAGMFGATKTEWSKGAYIQELTPDGYKRIWTNDFFVGLHSDLQEYFRHALDSAKRDKHGNVFNCLGLLAPAGADDKQQVAHLMQGYEALCTRAAINATDKAILWLHDGWISTQPQDVKAIEKAVSDNTGFKLKIESKRIELSGLAMAEYSGQSV